MGICKEHETIIDCWYDCDQCLEESTTWAHKHGHTHCVTPGNPEGDKGFWVKLKIIRWIFPEDYAYEHEDVL